MDPSDRSLPARPFVVSRDAPAPSPPAAMPAGPARLRRPGRSTVTPATTPRARTASTSARAPGTYRCGRHEPVGLHAGTAGGGPRKVRPRRRSAFASIVGADVVAGTSARVAGTGAGGGAFDRSRSPPPPSSRSPMASQPARCQRYGKDGHAGGVLYVLQQVGVVAHARDGRPGPGRGPAAPNRPDTGVDLFQVVPGPSSASGRTRPR